MFENRPIRVLQLSICIHFLVVWINSQMIGDQYFQRTYNLTSSLPIALSIKSKFRCAALCARRVSECNVAIFNPFAVPSCTLSNERFIVGRLTTMNYSMVIDFRRNNLHEASTAQSQLFTTDAPTTVPTNHFVLNTYGSLIDNGVNDLRNDYVIFNQDQAVILSGFVSNVSVKFCTLPTTAQPVLWIYAVSYTGATPYYIYRSMYQVPYPQINTVSATQTFSVPDYHLNVTTGQYVAIGFGRTTGGSPCRVIPGNSSFTNLFGGANQTTLVTAQASSIFSSQARAVAIRYTVLTPL